jgi:hypothetical protein
VTDDHGQRLSCEVRFIKDREAFVLIGDDEYLLSEEAPGQQPPLPRGLPAAEPVARHDLNEVKDADYAYVMVQVPSGDPLWLGKQADSWSAVATSKQYRRRFKITKGKYQGQGFLRMMYGDPDDWFSGSDETTTFLYASAYSEAKYAKHGDNRKQMFVLDENCSTNLRYNESCTLQDRYYFDYLCVNMESDTRGRKDGLGKLHPDAGKFKWMENRTKDQIDSNPLKYGFRFRFVRA